MRALVPTLLLSLLAACQGEDDCWIRIDTMGGHDLSWDEESEVACDSWDPDITGTLEMSWEIDFDEVEIDADWVLVGETGDFEGTVQVSHRADDWRSDFGGCDVSLHTHERVRNAIVRPDLYLVEGSVHCDDPLPGWAGTDTELHLGTVEFANSYRLY